MKIIIPATSVHKPVVKIAIDRLKKSFPEASFLIVCPFPEIYFDLSDSMIQIESDDKFAVVNKTELEGMLSPSKRHLVGWYYQQILKYSVLSASTAKSVLVLDADTVPLSEIRSKKNVFFTSKERHEVYAEHFKKLFNATPPFKASAITNFMWFDVEAIRSMLVEVSEIHQDVWWKVIIRIANEISENGAFSEYETYANWFSIRHGPHREVPIHIFRRGDLLLRSPADYQRVVEKVEIQGYDAVAFELNHRGGILRRLGARILLRLSIKQW